MHTAILRPDSVHYSPELSLFLPIGNPVEGPSSSLDEPATSPLRAIVANGALSGPNRLNIWACCSRACTKRFVQLPLAYVELSTTLNEAI